VRDMSDSDPSVALDYSHFLFSSVVDWYRNADLKAQIILTLDGAFVAFLTTSAFKMPEDLHKITERFTGYTWLFIVCMCLCLAASIVSALMCLWSRVFLLPKRDHILVGEKKRIKAGVQRYSPNVMLFFKTISWLDHDSFQEQLRATDKEFQIRALASQIYLLSKRVYVKHLLVNCGFVLAGASFILFLAGGMSYLARIK